MQNQCQENLPDLLAKEVDLRQGNLEQKVTEVNLLQGSLEEIMEDVDLHRGNLEVHRDLVVLKSLPSTERLVMHQ